MTAFHDRDGAEIGIGNDGVLLPHIQKPAVHAPTRRPLAMVIVDERLLRVGVHFIQAARFEIAQNHAVEFFVVGEIAEYRERIMCVLREHDRFVVRQKLFHLLHVEIEFDPRCAEQNQRNLARIVDAIALHRPKLRRIAHVGFIAGVTPIRFRAADHRRGHDGADDPRHRPMTDAVRTGNR